MMQEFLAELGFLVSHDPRFIVMITLGVSYLCCLTAAVALLWRIMRQQRIAEERRQLERRLHIGEGRP